MADFSPLSALAGGILIGLAAGVLWMFNGRLAGISGILGDALLPRLHEAGWRWAFLAGLLAGGFALSESLPEAFGAVTAPDGALLAAGLLVGVGTRLGSGCTSGHGVCGMARLSPRSIAATAVFTGVGALTVFVWRHLLAGGL